jgi:MFS family permease
MDMHVENARTRMTPRERIYAGIIALGVLMWSMNSLLSVTIMPSAVDEIGGLDWLSWATTAYVAASIVASATGDWVKGRIGGRAGMALGAGVFGLGAVICAMAPSMPVLLLGRTAEGFGGGIEAAISYTLIRSVFAERLWPRIFALIAGIWGLSAVAGPAIGGGLTELLDWRWAFLVMVTPAALLAAGAMLVLPCGRDDDRDDHAPILFMAVLACGIVLLGLAGNLPGSTSPVLALAGGLTLLVLAAAVDRRARRSALPSDAFSWSSPVGLGLATKFLLVATSMPASVYGAYLLQELHGASPLVAGYVVALEAIGWTVTAIVAERLPARAERAATLAGPAMVWSGVVVAGLAFGAGRSWGVVAGFLVTGGGFGLCWAFLSARIFRGSRRGEEDRAAAAVPTVESLGLALGAATVGAVGNTLGIADAAQAPTLAAIAQALFLVFGLAALAPVYAAWRIRRLPDDRSGAVSAASH